MGLMQREKGKRFERAIAALLRARWPNATVRRASQADRAHKSDVYTSGAGVLDRCWLELQDARDPMPLAKLQQAERDIEAVQTFDCMPVVAWHKLGARVIHATTRLWVIDCLRGTTWSHNEVVVTLTFNELLDVVATLEGAQAA